MIRALEPHDAEVYVALRREALAESPLAFAASPADDFAGQAARVRESLARAPDWVLFGAFAPELVGTVGLFRDRHLKAAQRMHLWGMYVTPAQRRRGLAAALLAAALDHARQLEGVSWVRLSVTSAAVEARRLYERAGFELWGTEPDALRHAGESLTEHHLALHLGGR